MESLDIAKAEERAAFRRIALRFTLLLWGLNYLVLTINGLIEGWGSATVFEVVRTILARGAWMLFGLALAFGLFLLIERLRSSAFRIQVAAIILLGVPMGLVNAVVGRILFAIIIDQPIMFRAVLSGATYWLWFYFGWAIAILAISYNLRIKAEQRMRSEAQALAHRAQMQALRYQLNPHFLFNAINSVAALVLDNQPQAAEAMLRRLSAFLRSGLQTDPLGDIELGQEIAQQQDYLAIEQIRFPDRLRVRIDVPVELERALVPSFILQPLVENAVKHGVAPHNGCTTIHIAASARDSRLVLSVVDDGGSGRAGSAPGSPGVGLRNIEQRLAANYADDFSFDAGPGAHGGFRAEISMPMNIAAGT